jgi:mevalonate pyrophosphate decarboxylase
MGAIGLRDDIKNYVNIADERLLKVVKAVMESYWDEETVAFTVDGKPLTKKMYAQELQNGILEIQNNETISQEIIEKESENW